MTHSKECCIKYRLWILAVVRRFAAFCVAGHVFVAAVVASAGTGYFSGCIRASLIR